MLWLISLILLPYWTLAINYCSISPEHTMCKYKGIGPTCGSQAERGISKVEIKQILELHNNYRSKIALGREKRGFPGPQPPAANMQRLVWDNNLAAVAQKWADQCIFQHDNFRRDPRFNVGQNMYFSSGFSNVDWTRAISAWYDEVTKFNSKLVNNFNFNREIAHYSQLVWGKTRYIGCGRITYGGAYRLHDYKRTEFILSSSPQNESFIDENNENKKNILHPKDIPIKTSKSTKILEKSTGILSIEENKSLTTEKYPVYPITTTHATVENCLEETIRDEINLMKSDNMTVYPITTTHSTRKKCSENTTKKNEDFLSETEDFLSINEDIPTESITNQPNKFSIVIPGYWVSENQPNVNGKIAGTFKSLDFYETPYFHTFINENLKEEEKLNTARKLRTSNFNSESLNSNVENLPQINNKLTPERLMENIYEEFGRDQILVCNYGQTGNYLYQPVYIKGRPCSQCPFGSICVNGLCT